MADNIIKPSIGMMPIDDIAEELKKRDDLISTANIAKALGLETSQLDKIVLSDNEDRSMANDSLKLGGKEASQYVTQSDKEAILDEAKDIMNSNPNEIQLLRDELYALKCELIKDGFIDDTMVADGFIDGFQNSNILYDTDSTEVASISSTGNTISQASKIVGKGEYAIFCSGKTRDEYSLSKATDETVTTTTFSSLPSDIKENETLIRKTLGSYVKGAFSFSNMAEETLGAERYTVLNDDSHLSEYKLQPATPGIAVRVKIPNKCVGRLKTITINATPHGSPSSLQCCVIKDKEPSYAESETNILTLAESNGNLIGKSSPVGVSDVANGEITFVIADDNRMYPKVDNANYIVIIEATAEEELTNDSYWNIQTGGKEITGGDLQTNNVTYEYNGTLKKLADGSDMLYTIVTQNISYGDEIPYRAGLYSTENPIKTLSYMNASRARLTLEINKEGGVTAMTDAFSDTFLVNTFNSNNNPFQGGDYVVVGTSIAKVASFGGSQIKLDRQVAVHNGDPVYRVGYMPQIETYMETIDAANQSKITNDKFSSLSLVGVIPSRNGNKSNKSDRLIFETDQEFGTFNRAKLQIAWSSPATTLSNDYIGRIYNLSLVFDKK